MRLKKIATSNEKSTPLINWEHHKVDVDIFSRPPQLNGNGDDRFGAAAIAMIKKIETAKLKKSNI